MFHNKGRQFDPAADVKKTIKISKSFSFVDRAGFTSGIYLILDDSWAEFLVVRDRGLVDVNQ